MVEHAERLMPGTELAQEVVAERAETAGQIAAREPKRASWRVGAGRILCVVVPIALWFAPLNLDPTIKHTLAIASFMIIAWIAIGLVEPFGLGIGSHVGRGMFIILTYTAGIFDKMMIAGAASITARGLIEKVGHVEVLWRRLFLGYLPCSLITIFVAWRLTLWLFPPEKPGLPGGAEHLRTELRKMGAWTQLEKKALVLILIAIGLWMTDMFHHISPAVIGLGVGLFAVLPRFGVLDMEDLKRLNYLPVFFVAAAVSMGQVLVSTKALDVLTDVKFAWMQPRLTDVS